MTERNALTQAELIRLLKYDPTCGVFTWVVDSNSRVRAGSVAGGVGAYGYIKIRIHGHLYMAHRLVWLYCHGKWPEVIDHIDGDRKNNRIENLRDVTRAINQQNFKRASTRSSSGFLGACVHRDKWSAEIHLNGKKTFIGVFDTPEAAHAAYLETKRRIHIGCTI